MNREEQATGTSQGTCFKAERIVNVKGCEETLVGGLLLTCQVLSKLVQESLLSSEDWGRVGVARKLGLT